MLIAPDGNAPMPESFVFEYPLYLLGEHSSLGPDTVASNYAGARFLCRVGEGVVMLLVFTEEGIAWEYVEPDRVSYFIFSIESAGHFANLLSDAISGGATHIAWVIVHTPDRSDGAGWLAR